ncbi:AMP-dependent synthetase, partial [bacterium]|nr:AMP-dependent synthetase [bacterium]
MNASERVQPDTLELFANTFSGSFGWNQNSMRAGYGLAESTVYVCDGSLEVLQVEREALEVHGIV